MCDFGLAEEIRSEKLHGTYGTAPFMCPEMIGGRGYDYKADIWSMGCIAYVLLVGEFPYQPMECNSKAMKALILSGDPAPRFEPSPNLRDKLENGSTASVAELMARARNFLQSLLCRDPSRRPTAAEALENNWLCQDGSVDAPGSTKLGGRINLRPVFEASLRVGAFDTRKISNDAASGSMDEILAKQQMTYNRQLKASAERGAKEARRKNGSRKPVKQAPGAEPETGAKKPPVSSSAVYPFHAVTIPNGT